MTQNNLLNRFPIVKDLIWGNSIALAWTWGLGLFFSIQFALMFGTAGLLWFSIPNAIGLGMFGVIVHQLSKKLIRNNINIQDYFAEKTKKYFWMFIIFQTGALSINVFGFIRYVAISLEYSLITILLCLFVIPLLIASYGRTANIKWIHLIFGIPFIIAILIILVKLNFIPSTYSTNTFTSGLANVPSIYFIGWGIATTISFLFAPWLDIQHWQRAIQIQEEKANLSRSYIIGGTWFFLIMLFHGFLALYLKEHGIHFIAEQFMGDIYSYRYSVITTWLNAAGIGIFYLIFLVAATLSSITSSFVSYRWYFVDLLKYENPFYIYVPYLLGYIIAGVLAGIGIQEEIYIPFMSFFFIYQYCIVLAMFDQKNLYPPDFNRTACILGLLLCVGGFFSVYFNTLGGLVLLCWPPLILISFAGYVSKRRLV